MLLMPVLVSCSQEVTTSSTKAATTTQAAAATTKAIATTTQAAATTTQPAQTLKIGGLVSLTGFASASESLIRDGLLLFQQWYNEQNRLTINGTKYNIEFVFEDVQSTAEGATAAATKLVNDTGVKFIVGGVVPFMTLAAGTVTEPAQVLRVILYTTHSEEYGPQTPYTFISNDATTDFAGPDSDYLVANFPNVKKIAVLTPDDGGPPIFMPMVQKTIESRGLSLAGDYVLWPLDATDFTSYVNKALAQKPDAIFFINGWPIHMGPMLKIAREAGFTGPIFGCHEDPYDIAAIAGTQASNNFYVHNIQVDSPQMTDIIKNIMSLSQAAYNKQSPTYVWGWNSAYCLMQAIEKAGSLDTTAVKTAWEGLDKIDTVYGPGVMGGLVSYGIKHNVSYATPFCQLVDGQVKFIGFEPVSLP